MKIEQCTQGKKVLWVRKSPWPAKEVTITQVYGSQVQIEFYDNYRKKRQYASPTHMYPLPESSSEERHMLRAIYQQRDTTREKSRK